MRARAWVGSSMWEGCIGLGPIVVLVFAGVLLNIGHENGAPPHLSEA